MAQPNTFVFPFESTSAYSRYWVLEDSYPGHQGTDYACSEGTPVYASISGIVVEARDDEVQKSCRGFGNTVLIRSGEYTVRYAHLRAGSVPFEVGDEIRSGDVVGETGNSGYTTNLRLQCLPGVGYHLHYEVRQNGGPGLNPYTHLGGLFRLDVDGSFFFPHEERTRFRYNGNILTCRGLITGGAHTNWYYTCERQANSFFAGEPVRVLVRLEDVVANHRYQVQTFREGVFQWQWGPDWNQVEPGRWQYSHFWATLSDSSVGAWEFRVHIDIGQGFEPLDSVTFTVHPPPVGYTYDFNATSCHGPVTGGWWTNWWYTCEEENRTFVRGETVRTLIRITNVSVDHRYEVRAYRNGRFEWQWGPDWIRVGAAGWRYSHFWPTLSNAQPGDWEFRMFVDTGSGFVHIDTVPFVVE